jgi:hypothetical protein
MRSRATSTKRRSSASPPRSTRSSSAVSRTRGGCLRREDLPRAPQARRAVPRLRHAARAGRLRGAHDLLLPHLPDRRPRPQDRRMSRLLR